MSDLLMLYAFTRLDALRCSLALLCLITFILAIALALRAWYCACADPENVDSYYKNETIRAKNQYEATHRWALRFVVGTAILTLSLIIIPSKTDVAIIVGGKIALDASRTPEARAIGRDVLDAIRAQLKRAKE